MEIVFLNVRQSQEKILVFQSIPIHQNALFAIRIPKTDNSIQVLTILEDAIVNLIDM